MLACGNLLKAVLKQVEDREFDGVSQASDSIKVPPRRMKGLPSLDGSVD